MYRQKTTEFFFYLLCIHINFTKYSFIKLSEKQIHVFSLTCFLVRNCKLRTKKIHVNMALGLLFLADTMNVVVHSEMLFCSLCLQRVFLWLLSTWCNQNCCSLTKTKKDFTCMSFYLQKQRSITHCIFSYLLVFLH